MNTKFEDIVRRNYTKWLSIYNNKREALAMEQQGEFLELIKYSNELG